MQAVMQPQLAKITSAAVQNTGEAAARSNAENKAGRRFLDYLMAALSAWAV